MCRSVSSLWPGSYGASPECHVGHKEQATRAARPASLAGPGNEVLTPHGQNQHHKRVVLMRYREQNKYLCSAADLRVARGSSPQQGHTSV